MVRLAWSIASATSGAFFVTATLKVIWSGTPTTSPLPVMVMVPRSEVAVPAATGATGVGRASSRAPRR